MQSSFSSTFEKVDMEVLRIFERINNYGLLLGKELEFIIQFALRELFNNAVEHGNKLDTAKRVSYILRISKDLFEVEVSDCGEGFDLLEVSDTEHKDYLTRQRHRGIAALSDIGFKLMTVRGKISALFELDCYNVINKGVAVKMKIETNNRTIFCKPDTSLVASNIREMVGAIKDKIDMDDKYDELIIDLSSSESIDSMGITFLIGIYKTIIHKEKRFKIKSISQEMFNLFKIMKLDEVFEFVE